MATFQVQGFFMVFVFVLALPLLYSAFISLPCKEFLLFQEALIIDRVTAGLAPEASNLLYARILSPHATLKSLLAFIKSAPVFICLSNAGLFSSARFPPSRERGPV